MKLSKIKAEQAHSICCTLDDLANQQLANSNDHSLSFIERKRAIKLAEFYIKRCFRVGNAYKLSFVVDLEYQRAMLIKHFDVTTTVVKQPKKEIVVEPFDWQEKLRTPGDSLNE